MVSSTLLTLLGIGIIFVIVTRNPVTQAFADISNIPPQSETSEQQIVLGGLRSTNLLGFDVQTAFANIRDNLTFGGALFQGGQILDLPNLDFLNRDPTQPFTQVFNLSGRRIR